jgi:hypothetical protein
VVFEPDEGRIQRSLKLLGGSMGCRPDVHRPVTDRRLLSSRRTGFEPAAYCLWTDRMRVNVTGLGFHPGDSCAEAAQNATGDSIQRGSSPRPLILLWVFN